MEGGGIPTTPHDERPEKATKSIDAKHSKTKLRGARLLPAIAGWFGALPRSGAETIPHKLY